MSFYQHFVRPLLFRLDAEFAHHLAVESAHWAGVVPLAPSLLRAVYDYKHESLQQTLAGVDFANPVGLAAGWDKNGRAVELLSHLGFGFLEMGSVSAKPSSGNPKPRLFRLLEDEAVVVNYGLPNEGAEAIAKRLSKHHWRIPLGINLVKTNQPDPPYASPDDIFNDYAQSFAKLAPIADYITLNLSCPNAEGGKDFFADAGNIENLLTGLQQTNLACPVFLKLAPNPDPANLEAVLKAVDAFPFVRGFIFNLPSGKPKSLELKTNPQSYENMSGAVAGPPVARLIDQSISEMYQRMPRDQYIIIGVGGISSAANAYHKIRLGASLVQVFTALIYHGPSLVKKINRGLVELLQRDGFGNIRDAVGTAHN